MSGPLFRFFICALLVVSTLSCDRVVRERKRVKDKAAEALEEVKEEASEAIDHAEAKAEEALETALNAAEEQIDKVIDKIIPYRYTEEPDSEENKQFFKDIVLPELTDDIHTIHGYYDSWAGDATILIGFRCADSTAQKIINRHNFKWDGEKRGTKILNLYEFPWMNKKQLEPLPRYEWNQDEHYFKEFYFDTDTGQAFFLFWNI